MFASPMQCFSNASMILPTSFQSWHLHGCNAGVGFQVNFPVKVTDTRKHITVALYNHRFGQRAVARRTRVPCVVATSPW